MECVLPFRSQISEENQLSLTYLIFLCGFQYPHACQISTELIYSPVPNLSPYLSLCCVPLHLCTVSLPISLLSPYLSLYQPSPCLSLYYLLAPHQIKSNATLRLKTQRTYYSSKHQWPIERMCNDQLERKCSLGSRRLRLLLGVGEGLPVTVASGMFTDSRSQRMLKESVCQSSAGTQPQVRNIEWSRQQRNTKQNTCTIVAPDLPQGFLARLVPWSTVWMAHSQQQIRVSNRNPDWKETFEKDFCFILISN